MNVARVALFAPTAFAGDAHVDPDVVGVPDAHSVDVTATGQAGGQAGVSNDTANVAPSLSIAAEFAAVRRTHTPFT